jgi:hypothetical protein
VTQIDVQDNQIYAKGGQGVQRSLILAAGIVLMVLIAGYAYSGTSDAPAGPKKEEAKTLKTGQTGSVGAVAPKSGTSVVERDKKRYENQKRAADRRAAEMKKAEKAKKPSKSGSSVVERDQKRYDAQKRAADRRAAEMKKAEEAEMMKNVKQKEPIDAQGQSQAK